MVDIRDLAHLKDEQDATDAAQDAERDLKALASEVRTSVDQDVIDAALSADIATKAPINRNVRSYFDVATSTLYTSGDGSDPQP